MKNIGKWLFIVGVVVAAIAGIFAFQASWLAWILALVAILAAIFVDHSDDVVNVGIRYLVLLATASVLKDLPFVGTYITGLFMGVLVFVGPYVLTTLVMWFCMKYFFPKKV